MDDSKEKNDIEPEKNDAGTDTDTDANADEQEFEIEKDAEYSSSLNKDVVASLRQKLKKSDEEKREYLLGWQKVKADYINSRKKDEEEKREIVKFAEADLISEIIPILDSFEMALANLGNAADTPKEWKKGIEQIYNQIKNVLSQHNLEAIEPKQGTNFNPHEAEAVGIVETDDAEKDDTVATIFQKGYKMHGKVIRPAKVQVYKSS